MPVQRRYYTGGYNMTSSLLSGLKKMQNVEDTEMKYKMDFNIITPGEYVAYAQKRRNEVSSETEQITWDRNIRGAQRTERSQWRANALLEFSRNPDTSSAGIKRKAQLIAKLYEDASADQDATQMIALETQFNNLIEQYQNKLEAEAKAGQASAKREVNRIFNETKNAIDEKRILIKTDSSISDVDKMAANAELDAEEAKATIIKLMGSDDEIEIGNLQEKIMNLSAKSINNAKYFSGTLKDQNGNIIDPADPQPGQVVTSFEAETRTDVMGNENAAINPNYIKYIENGKTKLASADGSQIITQTNPVDGSSSFVQSDAKIDLNKYAQMQSDDGSIYYSKIEQEKPADIKNYNPDGTLGKATDLGVGASEFVIDEYGNKNYRNNATGEYSTPEANKSIVDAADALSQVSGTQSKQVTKTDSNGNKYTTEQAMGKTEQAVKGFVQNPAKVATVAGLFNPITAPFAIGAAGVSGIKSLLNRGEQKKQYDEATTLAMDKLTAATNQQLADLGTETSAREQKILASTPGLAAKQASLKKQGLDSNIMPGDVSPVTLKAAVNTNSAPYLMPKPTPLAKQAAQNVLNPNGIIGANKNIVSKPATSNKGLVMGSNFTFKGVNNFDTELKNLRKAYFGGSLYEPLKMKGSDKFYREKASTYIQGKYGKKIDTYKLFPDYSWK